MAGETDNSCSVLLFGLPPIEIQATMSGFGPPMQLDLSEHSWTGLHMAAITSLDDKTDHELVIEARHGTAGAYGILVDRHHPKLLRYLIRQTGDRELAADLAQEAFLTAFRDLCRLVNKDSFAAWLYGIARNHMRMEWRRRRRVISLDWLEERTMKEVPSPRQEEDMATACHEHDLIQAVLDGLHLPLREALLLQSLGGFTAPEVAEILGISRAAAERRISRAKQQFRNRYEALNVGSGNAAL